MALLQWSPYEVPQSLWQVIELYAPTVELSEIKHIIGEDLIEQSHELFDEIYLLLDIWSTEASEPVAINRRDRLPESPILREQVVSQIQQFISNLDATKNHLLQNFISERKGLYQYATQKNRPGTSSSNNGRMTPSRPSSGRKSTSSTDLSVYRDSMSAFEIDKIVANIQAAFRDEHRVLKEDIEFLQNAIQKQHSDSSHTSTEEPSLNELRKFADELERKVVDISQPVFVDVSNKRPSSPKLKSLPKPPPMQFSEFKKLPTLPASQKQLSWRQRTLKKVNMPIREQNNVLRGLDLRVASPSSSNNETGLTPKPPPPRDAFQQSSSVTDKKNKF